MEEAIEPTCPNAWLAASHASSPRLAATVTSLSETDLNQRSKAGEWSIAQVLSDLGSAAEISTGLLQRGIAGDGAGPAREDLEPVWSDGGSLQGFPEEISDPTTGPSPGPRHVALETYLDRHIDGPCAPVLLPCVRGGGHWTGRSMLSRWARWPGRWCARRRSGPSTSRSAGRSSQLCGFGGSGFVRGRLGRPLSDVERWRCSWTALWTAPGPSMVADRARRDRQRKWRRKAEDEAGLLYGEDGG
ncbi:maleylpyruvate isomerase N-terminal domain-containing protein [Streptomyces rochei]|uniref:maleylpyruvate isomerase N-terminal domain-containing protein n=2 Tax=Streptomyces TaxID=1883 RepID=UPI00368F23F4